VPGGRNTPSAVHGRPKSVSESEHMKSADGKVLTIEERVIRTIVTLARISEF
jgi:hypothetical protein